jgi:hypothetical protein
MDERKMKKIILILLSIICLSSCFKGIYTDTPAPTGTFNEEITIGDTLIYYTSCNMTRQEVELYFVKRIRRILGINEWDALNMTYYMEKDTVIISQEDYRYTPDEFKEVLAEKNKIKRDTTIFHFTQEMCCSWELFDKMYNCYIKDERL